MNEQMSTFDADATHCTKKPGFLFFSRSLNYFFSSFAPEEPQCLQELST